MGRAPLVPGPRRWPSPNPWPAPRLATPERAATAVAAGARIHWPRTLLSKGPERLRREHLAWVPQGADAAALHLIALDHSGSMRHGGRLAAAKAYAARLVHEATRAGAQVALLLLGGQGVQWLQGAAPARRAAIAPLSRVGGGGGTPLAEGLREAQRSLHAHRRRHGGARHTLWLLTDGRSLEQPERPAAADRVVIVDFDDRTRPLGRCRVWAQHWGAELRQPPTP